MKWVLSSGYPLTCDFEAHKARGSKAPGVDLGCRVGTEVVAPRAGWVLRSGKSKVGGWYMWLVCLPHVYYICHLSRRMVGNRQRFKEGQVIALTGNSGVSTGPHLHFAVQTLVGGRWGWRDPLSLLPHRRTGLLISPAGEVAEMNVGVHLANHVSQVQAGVLQSAGLNAYKGLMRLDKPPNPVGDNDALDNRDWTRIIEYAPATTQFVLRAYCSMERAVMPSAEFVRLVEERLGPLVLDGPLYDCDVILEVHNEPNHPIEGFGPSQAGADAWAEWYGATYGRLMEMRARRGMGGVRFMWPGLAPGNWNHKEDLYVKAGMKLMRKSEVVGAHCYWQTRAADTWQLVDPGLGENYLEYASKVIGRRGIPLWVTEAGSANCHNAGKYPVLTAREQAEQYVDWCRRARGKVQGVTFFLYGLMGGWEGFAIHNETVYALGRYLDEMRG